SRTAPTSACIAHSRRRPRALRSTTWPVSSAPSIASASCTTRSGPINFSMGARRPRSIAPRRARTPGGVPPFDYPDHYLTKRVTNAGTIRLKSRLLFLANALKQHVVGLEEVDDGIWSIHFCNVLLARVDERDHILRA